MELRAFKERTINKINIENVNGTITANIQRTSNNGLYMMYNDDGDTIASIKFNLQTSEKLTIEIFNVKILFYKEQFKFLCSQDTFKYMTEDKVKFIITEIYRRYKVIPTTNCNGEDYSKYVPVQSKKDYLMMNNLL